MFWKSKFELIGLRQSVAPKYKHNFKCKFCNFRANSKRLMGQHYDTKHRDLIPSDMDGYRYFYYLLTGKECGSCINCHEPTEFNYNTMKYARFCERKTCKDAYREQFKNRMIQKYGKIHLLNDPDKQKEMLAARRISGEYQWSDNKTKISYVGSYELDFLKLLDNTLHWAPNDVIAPSPHVYEYEHDNIFHFYMPDFFLPSLDLEIEIKDDKGINISEISREKDKKKDELMRSLSNHINYIRILNKQYDEFLALVKECSNNQSNDEIN